MKRYFSLILAIAATVSAQIVPSTGNVRGPTSATDNAVARYDGTTGKLVQNSAVTIDDSGNATAADLILGTSGPSVKSTLSARAPRQGLVFDGTAQSTTSVPAFGTSDFTVVGFGFKSALTRNEQIVGGANNSFGLIAKTDGTLITDLEGFAANSASTGTFTAGKNTMFVYVRSGTTGTYFINGVAAGTTTDSQNYSVGCTVIGGSTANSNSQWTGALSVLIYNRALSADEVVALYEAGAPSGADYNSASNTSVATTNFTQTGYNSFTGASATGFTADFVSGVGRAWSGTFTAKNAGLYRVTFTLTLNSGALPGGAYLSQGVTTSSAQTAAAYSVASGANSFVVTANYSGTVSFQFFNAAGASNYTVSSFSATPLGLLLAPDAAQAGNGYVWNDQSGNLAQIVLPSSGVQWNLPSVAGQRIRGTTSTNGNEQLLGASVLLPAECQITHVRARARSGTPTITIGTASGGAQIVASVALSTTWLNCTIALTGGIVSSADDIWVGSNSTDVVEIDIAYQPLKL